MNRLEKQRQAQAKKGQKTSVSPRKIEPTDSFVTDESVEKPRKFPLPRLPHDSHDFARWNADKGEWSGSLIIIKEDGSFQEFQATARTRFTLLSALDRRYRAWLTAQEAKK